MLFRSPQFTTNLPNGSYNDYLSGLLYGQNITSQNGSISSISLSGGEVSIWQYNSVASQPQIGDVISTMGRVGNLVYIYGDGFTQDANVSFGDTPAIIENVTQNKIITRVPSNATKGYNNITISQNGLISNNFVYNILSNDQNQIIFHLSANTNYGENVYIVGNIPELGNWNINQCTEAMLNPNYQIGRAHV